MTALRLILSAAIDAVEAIAGLVLLICLLPWLWAMSRAMEREDWFRG